MKKKIKINKYKGKRGKCQGGENTRDLLPRSKSNNMKAKKNPSLLWGNDITTLKSKQESRYSTNFYARFGDTTERVALERKEGQGDAWREMERMEKEGKYSSFA